MRIIILTFLLSVAPAFSGYIPPLDPFLDSGQFGQQFGAWTLDSRSDLRPDRVEFDFSTGAAAGEKIGLGDGWQFPGNPWGFGWDPVLSHFTSLDTFGSYQLAISYINGPVGSEINAGLFINTGLTGPSGFPNGGGPGAPTNDTFWASQWFQIALGETVLLTLDFDNAEAYNITDNEAPHTGGGLGLPDGAFRAINATDRREISNIGFQIADFDNDALNSSITIGVSTVPEPGTTLVFVVLLAAIGWSYPRYAHGRLR